MKTIINNKKYDTELCEKIIDCKVNIRHKNQLGTIEIWHSMTIYKTQKGTYLKYVGGSQEAVSYIDYESLELLSENEVKDVLIKLQEIDIYEKEFGKVECG